MGKDSFGAGGTNEQLLVQRLLVVAIAADITPVLLVEPSSGGEGVG